MKRISGLILLSLLMVGCATTSNFDIMESNMTEGLDSCMGKLTKDQLIMKASTPTEIVRIDDGEIWIYKYRKSIKRTTTSGAGNVFSPFESESKSHDYALDVRLLFNNRGILRNYSIRGHIIAFNHPFEHLRCQ